MKALMFAGQGSQYKGMGKDLFKKYKELTLEASTILGYDLQELCISDPERKLSKTEYTQPALYVVNAFEAYNKTEPYADWLIGHSLGEYNALHAAGVFDFITGLKLVQKRGELMASSSGGGMAAVLEISSNELHKILKNSGHLDIDIANYNSPKQTIISGPSEQLKKVISDFENNNIKIIPLLVSAPFHSRYMKKASEDYELFLRQFTFSPFKVPVVSNVTGLPHQHEHLHSMLSQQIASSVLWMDSITFLLQKGVKEFEEVGGTILTKMVKEIKNHKVIEIHKKDANEIEGELTLTKNYISPLNKEKTNSGLKSTKKKSTLGCAEFKKEYGVNYAYVVGGMSNGISGENLIIQLAKSKILGFFGTHNLSLTKIEQGLSYITNSLDITDPFGVNIVYNYKQPDKEFKIIELVLKYGIKNIEISDFIDVPLSLVYYRVSGLLQGEDGRVICKHKIICKVSKPDIAIAFMSPPPTALVEKLLQNNKITKEQADMAQLITMSDDICVMTDPGGHTERQQFNVIFPAIKRIRDLAMTKNQYSNKIRIGTGGGIGTPDSVALAFLLGTDFVLTGSINLCSVESRISSTVKRILQNMEVSDTDHVPYGDMFELDEYAQVLRKGTLFSSKAKKLMSVFQKYTSVEHLPEDVKTLLEQDYFNNSLEEVWGLLTDNLKKDNLLLEIERAEQNQRYKMVLIIKYYFRLCENYAIEGAEKNIQNYQVYVGSALGAFNQYVKGTEMENWENRSVSGICKCLMFDAEKILVKQITELSEKFDIVSLNSTIERLN